MFDFVKKTKQQNENRSEKLSEKKINFNLKMPPILKKQNE